MTPPPRAYGSVKVPPGGGDRAGRTDVGAAHGRLSTRVWRTGLVYVCQCAGLVGGDLLKPADVVGGEASDSLATTEGMLCRGACSVRGRDRGAQRGPSCAIKQKNRTLVLPRAEPRGCLLLAAAAVRANISMVGYGSSGSSAMGSAVLHARQLLPVIFGDRGGQVTCDRGQLAEGAGDRGEADALERFAEVLPRGVELRP